MAKPTIQTWAVKEIAARLGKEDVTLEVGCGSGKATEAFKELGVNIQCSDVDRWHDPHESIQHTSGADLTKSLPFEDASFNAVVSFEVFEHLTNPYVAAEELARVLTDQGQLFLTMPNFWGLRTRWRYFWTGNINRSKVHNEFYRTNLREGRCPPHINTMPWPTMKFALATYGLQVEEVRGYQRNVVPHLLFWPFAVLVWLITRLSGRGRKRRFQLNETNRWSVLWGSHHVYIHARKVGVEAINAADADPSAKAAPAAG